MSDMERRITLRLLAYWEKLRRGRPMPDEQDIRSEDIADLWDYCFLVRVKDLDNYVHLGQAIIDAYHHGLDEITPVPLVSPNPRHLTKGYDQVRFTARPLMEDGEFRNLRNHKVKYRQCLLPLGQGTDVQAVFGVMRFKLFPA